MGASTDCKEDTGMHSNGPHTDLDDDDEFTDSTSIHDPGPDFLKSFCKKSSMSFFNANGLISHQINPYNDFIKNGLQKVFDSFGEMTVAPGYDPSKKGEGKWRYASVKFGKVSLEKPTFLGGEGKAYNMLPRHARLQKMAYSSRMKVNVHVQVYTLQLVKSDKFKTGTKQYLDRNIINEDDRDIFIGRIPVMVNSDLCWMKEVGKGDCDFDHGGYFLIKGAEKDTLPSRQPPGQLLDAALGKGFACGGLMRHATPFSTLSVDAIMDHLHRAGFSRGGNERVYNGRTGEMVRSLIFMGPTFYQRLIQMAEDIVTFRNTGPVHSRTRQPVADRKRFGGINFGEMERDCLIAHGASANLHERLFTLSGSSQIHIYQKCKNVANVILRSVSSGRKIRGPYCRICESAEEIFKVNVPCGAKLLCQELFSMGINLKFETRLC